MKKIIMMRHEDKDGSFLSSKGIKESSVKFLPDNLLPLAFVVSSDKLRACLTALLICNSHRQSPVILPTDKTFNTMYLPKIWGWDKKKFKNLVQEKGNHLHAYKEMANTEQLANIKRVLLKQIKLLFEKLSKNETGLLVCHSPIIELTLEAIANKPAETYLNGDIPYRGYIVIGYDNDEIRLLEVLGKKL